MTDHDPRPHLDGVLKAITITMNEHIAGDITDQNAASTYLAAIASTLTNIGRTLADIRDTLTRPTAGTCTAIYRTTTVAPHHPTDDTTTIPAPTGLCPAADTTHTSNETVIHGCTLTYRHNGPHTSGTGHTWHDTPRTCGAYRNPDDWNEVVATDHGPLTDWPCVLVNHHGGPHLDRDGDAFYRT